MRRSSDNRRMSCSQRASCPCHVMAWPGRRTHVVQRYSGGSGWGLRNGSFITGINASGMPPGKHIPACQGREAAATAAEDGRAGTAAGWPVQGPRRSALPGVGSDGRTSHASMRTGHGGRPWLCPVCGPGGGPYRQQDRPEPANSQPLTGAVLPGRAPFPCFHGECLFAERSVPRMTHCSHCRSEMSQAPVRRWCHCAATAQRFV